MVSMAANTGEALEKVVERKYPMHLDLMPDLAKISEAYARRKENSVSRTSTTCSRSGCAPWSRTRRCSGIPATVRVRARRRVPGHQPPAARIVDAVAGGHRNLMVVGDDAQSIYSSARTSPTSSASRIATRRESRPPRDQLPQLAAGSTSPTRRSPTTASSSPRTSPPPTRRGRFPNSSPSSVPTSRRRSSRSGFRSSRKRGWR